jgi:hypothetical protein
MLVLWNLDELSARSRARRMHARSYPVDASRYTKPRYWYSSTFSTIRIRDAERQSFDCGAEQGIPIRFAQQLGLGDGRKGAVLHSPKFSLA